MHNVANMNADFDFNAAISWGIYVALGQCPLDFDGALRRFQRAVELDQKSVTDRLDLRPVKARKYLAQQSPMFFEQLKRELVVAPKTWRRPFD